MLAVPTAAHSAVLAAVSPRKLWLAVEGDLVLTMKPISPEFKRYACSLMSIDPDRIDTLTPLCSDTSFLAEAVKDKVILNRLLRFIDANPSAQFLSYALDYPTWNLIEQLGIKVTHYSRSISPLLQQHIFRLNRKSAFRQVAASLGLPVVPGGSCDGLKALTELAASMLTKYGKIIVKLDRSSNGYGHLVLTQRSLTSSLKTQLQEHYRKYERSLLSLRSKD